MKLLMLHPPSTRRSYASLSLLNEPVTQIHLAPVLARRHELRFVDLRIARRLDRELSGFRPDAALVGVHSSTLGTLDRVLGELRSRCPGIRILLTGDAEYGVDHLAERPMDFAHPLADALATSFAILSLQHLVPRVLDAWERNEGLEGIPGLLLRQEHGGWIQTTPFEDRIGDTGVPDRRVLGRFRGRYRFGGIGRMAFLFSTFGCRYRCRFCTMSKQDGTIWVRDRGHVLRELELMTEPNVFLADFEPLQAPDALAELIDGIERRGIHRNIFMMTRADAALENLELLARFKEAGLRWIFLGLDGHSQERLREQNKACQVETNEIALRAMQDLGLAVLTSFAVRSDFTRSDFAELRDYVRRLRPPMFGFTIETPLVGTRYFDDTESRLTTRDWSLYDLFHAVLPTAMPLADFYHEMTRLYELAARMSSLGVLGSYPLRDLLRNMATGPLAIARTFGQAKDHEAEGAAIPQPSPSSLS